MIIGLYDLDLFFFRGNRFPNLELMKYYNYHYQKGDKVIMLNPNSVFNRCDKIIYFKEHIQDFLKKDFCFHSKGERFGRGFYGNYNLPQEIYNMKPVFDPYDLYPERVKFIGGYEALKKSSLIRIETNDFFDYDSNRAVVWIADENPLKNQGFLDFIEQHDDKHLYHFYYKLLVNSPELYEKYLPYFKRFKRAPYINFNCSNEFIFNHMHDTQILYELQPFQGETKEEFLKRAINILLIYKKFKVKFAYCAEGEEGTLIQSLTTWVNSKQDESYYKYCTNKAIKQRIDLMPSSLRTLFKQNPNTYNP